MTCLHSDAAGGGEGGVPAELVLGRPLPLHEVVDDERRDGQNVGHFAARGCSRVGRRFLYMANVGCIFDAF